MINNTVSSLAQVKTRRVSNKPSLDRSTTISPILISRAAAIVRIRARHRVCLDILTLFDLIDFHLQCKRVLEDISSKPLQNGYVSGVVNGRRCLRDPATYYFECTRASLWRLEVLREYHRSSLSKEAALIIEQTIEQHMATLLDMLNRREGLAAPGIH
jgi:hypothetical protein